MSQLIMAKLSVNLQSVCFGAEDGIGFEHLKTLRKFEAQIQAVEPQKST